MRRGAVYKNHKSLLHNIGVIALCYTFFCPEHNMNIIKDINLQPFSNKQLFGEHPSVLQILLLSISVLV